MTRPEGPASREQCEDVGGDLMSLARTDTSFLYLTKITVMTVINMRMKASSMQEIRKKQ